jgi:phosphoribosylformimino-5-aminoimidazole carboxamide ribotide isomerase
MIIFPAIDLKDGRCVRLRQGRADDVTVYGSDPVQMARQWAAQGAQWLHVVDLDGAFSGHPVHTEIIRAIVKAIDIPVEVGGGLRTDEDIRTMLQAGVSRVVLGTRACADPGALAPLVADFHDHLAVGIDARNGRVQIKGWVETTETSAVDLAVRMASIGVKTLIYTDTATDGMLTGPNIEGVRQLCGRVRANIVASGGVSGRDDIARLAAIGAVNLQGVIVGKALYEGTATLAELTTAAAHP